MQYYSRVLLLIPLQCIPIPSNLEVSYTLNS